MDRAGSSSSAYSSSFSSSGSSYGIAVLRFAALLALLRWFVSGHVPFTCPLLGMARSTLDSMLLAADSHVSKHTLKMPWEKGSMKAIFDARPSLMPAVPVIQSPSAE